MILFTGLVEEIGKVLKISKGTNSSQITIKAEKVLDDAKLGDSIAVNGTCVTAIDFKEDCFTVDVMAETLRMSNLGNAKMGSMVNLERALRIGDRLGGHIVSGHIDGTGSIVNIHDEDISTWLEIETSSDLLKYIVLKGSVALDGVSLTVADLSEKSFSVSLIPHTKGETILHYKKVGDVINIECDLIGKFVEKMISNSNEQVKNKSNIDSNMLTQYGFM